MRDIEAAGFNRLVRPECRAVTSEAEHRDPQYPEGDANETRTSSGDVHRTPRVPKASGSQAASP